jgi:hypothetical protein
VSSQSPVDRLRREVHYWFVWVYTEARTALRAIVKDFFFNCWCLKIPSDNRIRHVPGRKTLDWKRSRISIFEVEALPHSCIAMVQIGFEYCFVYENFVVC